MGKISEFTELTAADGADLLPIVDVSAGVTKNIKIESLGINLPTLAEVDSVAPTDKMLLYDVSASAYKSVEAGDVGINISTLTEVDAIASGDKIPVYDVSTSSNKYVEAGDLTAGSITQGLYSALPTLAVGAQYYCTDKDLHYLGTAIGNRLINNKNDYGLYKFTTDASNVPTLTSLDGIGGSVTMTYVGTGTYNVVVNAGFTLDVAKSFIIAGGSDNTGPGYFAVGRIVDSTNFRILVFNGTTGNLADTPYGSGFYKVFYFMLVNPKLNRI